MFIELVDDLRCPRPHEEIWLVAAADRTEGRDILEGTLGCPVCHAEYPIHRGIVWFTSPDPPPAVDATAADRDAELAMRLAAFLDLGEARGLAVLSGSWGTAAALLRGVVPAHMVVLNPTTAVPSGDGVSVLVCHGALPLAESSSLGIALDAAHATPTYSGAAVRALGPRGRLVAPAGTPVPEGVTEVARDGALWVAERAAAPPQLVVLRSRGA